MTAREVGRVLEAIEDQVEERAARERLPIMEGKVIPLAPPVLILYIAMDGTGVPVVPAQAVGRKCKQTEIAKTRESKMGAVFTQTTLASRRTPDPR